MTLHMMNKKAENHTSAPAGIRKTVSGEPLIDAPVSKKIETMSGIISAISFKRGKIETGKFEMRPEMVIVRPEKGSLFAAVRDDHYLIGPGEFILIEPYAPHILLPGIDDTEPEGEMLCFTASADPEDKSSTFRVPGSASVLTPEEPHYGEFVELYETTAGFVSAVDPDPAARTLPSLFSAHGSLELLCSYLDEHLGWDYVQTEIAASWPILEKPVRFICENLQNDISLGEITEHSQLSTYYCAHKFREVFGDTIMRCVLRLRLGKSLALLVQSTKSISEVAACCGFSSLTTFCTVFKKRYGHSPMTMRRMKMR